MERSEFKASCESVLESLRGRVAREPLLSLVIAFILGAVLVAFHKLVIPLVILAAVVLLFCWYLAKPGSSCCCGSTENHKSDSCCGGSDSSGEKEQ